MASTIRKIDELLAEIDEDPTLLWQKEEGEPSILYRIIMEATELCKRDNYLVRGKVGTALFAIANILEFYFFDFPGEPESEIREAIARGLTWEATKLKKSMGYAPTTNVFMYTRDYDCISWYIPLYKIVGGTKALEEFLREIIGDIIHGLRNMNTIGNKFFRLLESIYNDYGNVFFLEALSHEYTAGKLIEFVKRYTEDLRKSRNNDTGPRYLTWLRDPEIYGYLSTSPENQAILDDLFTVQDDIAWDHESRSLRDAYDSIWSEFHATNEPEPEQRLLNTVLGAALENDEVQLLRRNRARQ